MIEKVQKEKLTGFFKTLKTIYAAKSAIKSMAEDGYLRGIKGMYYGSEAVSTGICAALGEKDKLVNTCDGIGNLIARGGNIKNIFAEMLGKSDGYNKGVRGFLNITVPEIGIYSANSFSDTQVAMSTGFALAAKIKGEQIVVAAFYNSNTSNEGIIHESMNIASAFDLPVLFVCETGLGAIDSKSDYLIKSGKFSKRSIGYGIKGHSVDGMDVGSVYVLADKVINDIRQANRPAIIECFTGTCYESFKHNKNKKAIENAATDKESIIARIIDSFEREFLNKGILTLDEAKHLEEDAIKLVSEAVEFGKNSAELEPEILEGLMYADKYINIPKQGWLS